MRSGASRHAPCSSWGGGLQLTWAVSYRGLSPVSSHPRAPEQGGRWIPGTRPGMTSARWRLVPPLLQGDVVLGHVGVVEIDQRLDLAGGEADARIEVGGDDGVLDRGVVAHVDGEGLLRALLEHGI